MSESIDLLGSSPMTNPNEPMSTLEAMRAVIFDRMARAPRSNQAAVGPSELGGCERKLGHRLAYGKSGQVRDSSSWRPQVGTFVHAGLGAWFSGAPRWIADMKVGQPAPGTLDLYDTSTATIVDFKVVGITTLKDAKAGRVAEKYRVQLALYGLGVLELGMPVKTLALWFLPSGGVLDDAIYHEIEFTPELVALATRAVERRDRLKYSLRVSPDVRGFIESLEVADDYCSSCPVRAAGMCAGFAIETQGIVAGSLGLTIA